MPIQICERIGEITYAIRDLEVGAPRGVIKLNIGDPAAYDFRLPKIMAREICNVVAQGLNFYADSQGVIELREVIAKREKISPDDVIITAGTSEAVNFLFAALVRSNAEILLPCPVYPQYPSMVRLWGGKPVFYECNKEENWQPSVESIKRQITKRTVGLVIINPNNPTGAVYSKNLLAEISQICEKNNIVIISDEIYCDLTFEKRHIQISDVASSEAVMLNGASKCYIVPGWRIGWLTFHNFKTNALREAILKLCRLRLCANTPAQYAIAKVMKGKNQIHISEFRRKLRARRDFVVKKFEEAGINCVKPEGTFYAFPWIVDRKMRWRNDLDFVLQLRDKKKVLVVHGGGFEYKSISEEKYFRIVTLPPIKVLDEALGRIARFLEK